LLIARKVICWIPYDCVILSSRTCKTNRPPRPGFCRNQFIRGVERRYGVSLAISNKARPPVTNPGLFKVRPRPRDRVRRAAPNILPIGHRPSDHASAQRSVARDRVQRLFNGIKDRSDPADAKKRIKGGKSACRRRLTSTFHRRMKIRPFGRIWLRVSRWRIVS
jgi:hypothetical protein